MHRMTDSETLIGNLVLAGIFGAALLAWLA